MGGNKRLGGPLRNGHTHKLLCFNRWTIEGWKMTYIHHVYFSRLGGPAVLTAVRSCEERWDVSLNSAESQYFSLGLRPMLHWMLLESMCQLLFPSRPLLQPHCQITYCLIWKARFLCAFTFHGFQRSIRSCFWSAQTLCRFEVVVGTYDWKLLLCHFVYGVAQLRNVLYLL